MQQVSRSLAFFKTYTSTVRSGYVGNTFPDVDLKPCRVGSKSVGIVVDFQKSSKKTQKGGTKLGERFCHEND